MIVLLARTRSAVCSGRVLSELLTTSSQRSPVTILRDEQRILRGVHIEGQGDFNVSASHAGELRLFAISTRPVGCDLERTGSLEELPHWARSAVSGDCFEPVSTWTTIEGVAKAKRLTLLKMRTLCRTEQMRLVYGRDSVTVVVNGVAESFGIWRPPMERGLVASVVVAQEPEVACSIKTEATP